MVVFGFVVLGAFEVTGASVVGGTVVGEPIAGAGPGVIGSIDLVLLLQSCALLQHSFSTVQKLKLSLVNCSTPVVHFCSQPFSIVIV